MDAFGAATHSRYLAQKKMNGPVPRTLMRVDGVAESSLTWARLRSRAWEGGGNREIRLAVQSVCDINLLYEVGFLGTKDTETLLLKLLTPVPALALPEPLPLFRNTRLALTRLCFLTH